MIKNFMQAFIKKVFDIKGKAPRTICAKCYYAYNVIVSVFSFLVFFFERIEKICTRNIGPILGNFSNVNKYTVRQLLLKIYAWLQSK